MFRTLRRLWGPQHWWPAESAFEVIVGAFLTQNTSWTNVERAMVNLRAANALSVSAIRAIPLDELEQLVRPSGYFRQKAQRLKMLVAFLDERYGGSLDRMFAEPTPKLREELLALNGVGPETADSILLYAGSHESFVVDAYTRRILERHGLISPDATYDDIKTIFERAFDSFHVSRFVSLAPVEGDSMTAMDVRATKNENRETGRRAAAHGKQQSGSRGTSNEKREASLEQETALYGAAHPPSYASQMLRSPRAQAFNEVHAMVVGIGKNYCLKTAPLCEVCPLKKYLPER